MDSAATPRQASSLVLRRSSLFTSSAPLVEFSEVWLPEQYSTTLCSYTASACESLGLGRSCAGFLPLKLCGWSCVWNFRSVNRLRAWIIRPIASVANDGIAHLFQPVSARGAQEVVQTRSRYCIYAQGSNFEIIAPAVRFSIDAT